MKINDNVIIKDHINIKILRKKSEDLTFPLNKEDEKLAYDMYEYVVNSTIKEIAEKENLKPAVGISAVQVGVHKKIIVVVLKDENDKIYEQYILINPKIISESVLKSYLKQGEGCLSVEKKHQGFVYRSAKIKVKGYNLLTKKEEIINADGFLSIVLQHEIDHLNGILYYDRINQNNPFIILDNSIAIE